jgi:UDP-glucuronate 4-epimerase
MKILLTGSAGFIGMHVAIKLLKLGFNVTGIDNFSSYYDVNLKKARLKYIQKLNSNFIFNEIDICNEIALKKLFSDSQFEVVIHLAAQAGVRYSIENPKTYLDTNINGFLNILENSKNNNVEHLVYASSSSVYGLNSSETFSESDHTDHPIAIYGVTKKTNELMAHSYSSLYGIPTTGMRFFTVYGPWGRPDMALFIFTKAILDRKPIKVFNNRKMVRDFTYIDDIAEGVVKIAQKRATISKNFNSKLPDPSVSSVPYRIFNIGNSQPRLLDEYIFQIEKELGIKAIIDYQPMQKGDVVSTSSNTSKLENWINFKPNTSIERGIKLFINWYKYFYRS